MDKIIQQAKDDLLASKNQQDVALVYLKYFGKNGIFTALAKKITEIKNEEKHDYGKKLNETKKTLLVLFEDQEKRSQAKPQNDVDITYPPRMPSLGSLHLTTTAIREIVSVFEKIGFARQSYPEVEYDWYAFQSLNFPDNHPARDDFETFFMDAPFSPDFGKMLLSVHTSSGQIREMERLKGKPPVRMINISKCYRPNWDVSHTPMFHQFEGLVIDKGINITHLKGILEYFVKAFFADDRKIRLRPYHFQFTEPSFEVDINCAVCLGSGKIKNGKEKCRMCKEGWLELGGSGMVHPNVLKNGNFDPEKYTGFAFGWGVERTYLMKSGINIPDLRMLYENDIRFLKQF